MSLQRFYDVSQASDVASFERGLKDFAEHLGFPLFVANFVIEKPGTQEAVFFRSVHNTPEGFLAQATDPEDVKRDSVIARYKRLSVPFVYDQSVYVSDGAADLWEAQAAYGYRTGVCAALHLPERRHFTLGLDRDRPLPKDEEKLVRMMADLQLMAVHASSAAERLLIDADVEPVVPQLSARELEILKWTHAGKSTWETSVILGVSEATVNFHLRKVHAKLGVNSKHQAVLKALALKLIG